MKKITNLDELNRDNIGKYFQIHAENKSAEYSGKVRYLEGVPNTFQIKGGLNVSGGTDYMSIVDGKLIMTDVMFELKQKKCRGLNTVYLGSFHKSGIMPKKYLKLLTTKE